MKGMWQAFIAALSTVGQILGFIEQKRDSNAGDAKDQVKHDRIFDKWVRKEPKELLSFTTKDKYEEELNTEEDLYWGTRTEIKELILEDPAKIIHTRVIKKRSQKKWLMDEVEEHPEGQFFIMRLHPKSDHRDKLRKKKK